MTGALTQTGGEGKGRKGRRESDSGTDLEVLVLLRTRSEGVAPSSGVAQGREEVAPCNQIQLGTFLDEKKKTSGVFVD